MAKGKYLKKRVFRPGKGLAILLAVVLLLSVAAGGTVAYLAANGGSVTNTFEEGYVTCSVANGVVTNTGNVPAYIRATAVANWVDGSGNIFAGDASCTLSGEDWESGTGGFMYYKHSVDPNATTTTLTATPSGSNGPSGCSLQVTIVAEAIQAEGGAAASAWGYTPSGS